MTTATGAAASAADTRTAPAMVELHRVTKKFGGARDVVALDLVSLAIPRGEIVSIIGPSGSGKSTLLNLIGGLDRPTSGQVSIDGAPLADLSDDGLTRVRRDKIGFVFQFFNLLPTLSCVENVGLPLHLRGWPRKNVDDRARELLNLVRLGTGFGICPRSSPAASASAWQSRVPCRSTRRSCWRTNRPGIS